MHLRLSFHSFWVFLIKTPALHWRHQSALLTQSQPTLSIIVRPQGRNWTAFTYISSSKTCSVRSLLSTILLWFSVSRQGSCKRKQESVAENINRKAPRWAEREENSKTKIFLHTFPHSLFTFSCESFGLSCVCLVKSKKKIHLGKRKFSWVWKFSFWLFSHFSCALAKTFSQMVNKSAKQLRKKFSNQSWFNRWDQILWSLFTKFSVHYNASKIYIIIFFFVEKKENSKKSQLFVREKWKLRSGNFSLCKKSEENFFILMRDELIFFICFCLRNKKINCNETSMVNEVVGETVTRQKICR